jgi:hypothetical protein
MKRSFIGVLAIALVALTGCNRGTPGGPGASDPTAKQPLYGQANDTFNLSVPTLSTSLKQGDTKEGSIGIKRGKNFGEDVTLAFADVPEGVTFDPTSPVIKHGDTEAKFTLKAGGEAPPGDFKVKVTGHPTKGGDATNEFKLTVAHKDTFHLSGPFLSTTLKQGDTTAVSIGLKRDKDFDQDVTLTCADLPKGVTFDPANPVIKHGEAEAKLTFKAEDAAPLGDFVVKVTGHPTRGAEASKEFKLTVAHKDTFTLSVPLLSTTLKQGDTKAVSIGIKRDKSFDQDVTLQFTDVPKGVTLEPYSPVIKHGDTEAKFTLKASEDASVGDFGVKVTGHPAKGADAANEFKLTVAKK